MKIDDALELARLTLRNHSNITHVYLKYQTKDNWYIFAEVSASGVEIIPEYIMDFIDNIEVELDARSTKLVEWNKPDKGHIL